VPSPVRYSGSFLLFYPQIFSLDPRSTANSMLAINRLYKQPPKDAHNEGQSLGELSGRFAGRLHLNAAAG
jgi:hypothetical protein